MATVTHIPINSKNQNVKEKFFIRYATNRFTLHTSTISDYNDLIRNLDENRQYHTYTNRKDKTRVFVDGLPSDLATEDIALKLQKLGIEALKCNPMRCTAKILHMITTKVTSVSKH